MQWSIHTDLSEESIIFSCIIHSEENGVGRERRPAFLIWRESRVTVQFTSGRLSGLLLASYPCSTCAHCTLTCSYLLCSCSAMRRSAKRSLLQFWWGSKLSSFTVTLLLPHIKLQGEEEYLQHTFAGSYPHPLHPLVTRLLPKNFVIPKWNSGCIHTRQGKQPRLSPVQFATEQQQIHMKRG